MGLESWPSFQKSTKTSKEEKTALKTDQIAKQESSESPQEADIYTRTKAGLAAIYQEYDDPNQKLSEIIKRIEPFFRHIDKKIFPDEKIEEIRKNLQAGALIQDKDKFLELVMETLKPILDLRVTETDKFEEAQARVMNETSGFTEINRLLSYGKSGLTIHIHAPPGETISNKITLYREGMRKLALIINNDPEIKQVIATSHLVTAHPGLFTKAGFRVENVPDELKQKHFAGEKREIKMATIDREEFLKKFLKEK